MGGHGKVFLLVEKVMDNAFASEMRDFFPTTWCS